MSGSAPRRSARQTWSNYTSFGRDYLAKALGWSRPQLDAWLLSDTVYPHLLLWHKICIDRARRCNESIDWINTGYFFKDCNLEEDVLLLCLGEGNHGSDEDAGGATCKPYADYTAQTYKWTTIELWARSVWRITQDNCGKGAIFDKAVKFHPAAAYGIVFDMLCIAFHNIAYVGPESVWSTIINNACIPVMALTPTMKSISVGVSSVIACQVALDTDPDQKSEDGVEQYEELLEDYETSGEPEDSDFSSASEAETESVFMEAPKKLRGRKVSPTAPVKATGGSKRARTKDVDKEGTPSKKIKRWAQSVPSQKAMEQDPNNMMNKFDEDGQPITGYHSASTVLPPLIQQEGEHHGTHCRDSAVSILATGVDAADKAARRQL